jgi:hypothetical protein
MAGPQIIQSVGFSGQTGPNNSVSFATAPTPGNLVVFAAMMGIGNGSLVTASDNQGNLPYLRVVVANDVTNGNSSIIFLAKVANSSGTFTVSYRNGQAGGFNSGWIAEVAYSSLTYEGTPGSENHGTATTSWTQSAGTAATNDDLLIYALSLQSNPTSVGWTGTGTLQTAFRSTGQFGAVGAGNVSTGAITASATLGSTSAGAATSILIQSGTSVPYYLLMGQIQT